MRFEYYCFHIQKLYMFEKVALSFSLLNNCQGDEASAFGMLKCQGQDMKMTDAQMNHMKECAAAIGVKDKKEMTMEKFPVSITNNGGTPS